MNWGEMELSLKGRNHKEGLRRRKKITLMKVEAFIRGGSECCSNNNSITKGGVATMKGRGKKMIHCVAWRKIQWGEGGHFKISRSTLSRDARTPGLSKKEEKEKEIYTRGREDSRGSTNNPRLTYNELKSNPNTVALGGLYS